MMNKKDVYRETHRYLKTRKWRHYKEHGHWPDIVDENELLGHDGYCGFTTCLRCDDGK